VDVPAILIAVDVEDERLPRVIRRLEAPAVQGRVRLVELSRPDALAQGPVLAPLRSGRSSAATNRRQPKDVGQFSWIHVVTPDWDGSEVVIRFPRFLPDRLLENAEDTHADEVERGAQSASIVLPTANLGIPAPGRYEIKIAVDGTPISVIPFSAVQA